MSQVTFKSTYRDRRIEVMAGWDRPLRHYFLTVFDLDASDDDPETVWSTLESPSALDNTSTERLRKKLGSMDISVPEGFWERVERQEGNAVHAYENGNWCEF